MDNTPEQQSGLILNSSVLLPRISLPAQVAELLRNQIRSGQLKSGERLVETRIARQLGISQQAVREGLKTLEGEGLAVHRPMHGYRVTALSEEEIDHIYRVRIVIEELAVQLTIENQVKWNPQELTQAYAAMQQSARQKDVRQYFQNDLQFHETLWRLSGNPFLVRALTQVAVPFFAFCMIKRLRELDIDLEANASDHGRIVQAILEGDKENARWVTRQMLQKFWNTTRNLSKDHGRKPDSANAHVG